MNEHTRSPHCMAFEDALQAYLDGAPDSPTKMELAYIQLVQANIPRELWIGKALRLEEAGMARTAIQFLQKAEDDGGLAIIARKYRLQNPRLALRAWISMTNSHPWTPGERDDVYELIDVLKPCIQNREDVARICDGYAAMNDLASLQRYETELFSAGKAHYAKFVRARMPGSEPAVEEAVVHA